MSAAIARVKVRGVKVNTLIPPGALPPGLVPPEPQPAGNPTIEVEMEGSPIVLQATLNGKAIRRALKVIAEHGPDGVNVLLQGNLKPTETVNLFIIEAAGLSVTPKTPKAEAP
jgi:hypothetical protein